MTTAAVRFPVAVDVNVTVILQFAPAAMLVPQVFVWEKSVALVPVIVKPVKFNCVLPTFASVTFCAALVVPTGLFPKNSFGLESETTVPTPLSGTACGLAGSESPALHSLCKPLGSPTHEELVSVDRLRSLTQRGSFRHGGTAIAVVQIFSFSSRKFSLAPLGYCHI
jgi:hypothetical protein